MSGLTFDTGETYRNDRPYPFCPGCGHAPILDALDEALVLRGTDPAKVVIVTDIGCSGLSDQYFATGAFHGLHGRSITYATGIKLADPSLDVIVVMGDGGTGIGGAHLIAAARRNVDITVVVMNNLNFGMTGGQHSATTPVGAVTPTTPGGNLERPLDICGTAAVNGAAFAHRTTSFDADLGSLIAEAMGHSGFAVLDVWELCSAYYVRSNRFTRAGMLDTMEGLGLAAGPVARRDVEGYSAAYRRNRAADDRAPQRPRPITLAHRSPLQVRRSLLLAGAAGGRVRSAARHVARAAIASGLWATQRDDYPVTVKTGHSIASLVLAPHPIEESAARADVVVLVAEEGIPGARRAIARMDTEGPVVVLGDLPCDDLGRPYIVLDPDLAGVRLGKSDRALAAMAAVAALLDLFPIEALEESVREAPKGADRLVEIVGGGVAMAAACSA